MKEEEECSERGFRPSLRAAPRPRSASPRRGLGHGRIPAQGTGTRLQPPPHPARLPSPQGRLPRPRPGPALTVRPARPARCRGAAGIRFLRARVLPQPPPPRNGRKPRSAGPGAEPRLRHTGECGEGREPLSAATGLLRGAEPKGRAQEQAEALRTPPSRLWGTSGAPRCGPHGAPGRGGGG